jgi:hypothetical protein
MRLAAHELLPPSGVHRLLSAYEGSRMNVRRARTKIVLKSLRAEYWGIGYFYNLLL